MNITQLVPGQELRCWGKLGIALQVAYAPGTKQPYYKSPTKTGMARSGDLTVFGAFVRSNNTETHVLSLTAYPLTSMFGTQAGPGQDCELHYSYFQRIRLLSQINFQPRPNEPKWPTKYSPLSGEDRIPYKKLYEVKLSW